MLGKCNGGHCIKQTLLKGWQEIENIYWQKIVEIPFLMYIIGSFDHNANSILQIPAFSAFKLSWLNPWLNIEGRPINTKAIFRKFLK